MKVNDQVQYTNPRTRVTVPAVITEITDLGGRRGGGLFYTVKTEAGKEHRARAASLQTAA
ncbi:TPA: hypothetical protein PKO72_004318 [Aeromonas hydrophila]|uniref:hypothetical protein n=1 Tax=Aeromonas hydrophila TaxID=644 RepID=UPI001CCF5D84|nr:hypothetical protein [Aeromonas hydrophila]UBQ50861.1 hypothetical protein LCH17_01660 [Aeromonas hydrophila]HDI1215521.1 hypothetical protein [Aeromonas hydrophila]